jgi:hypothetical protein
MKEMQTLKNMKEHGGGGGVCVGVMQLRGCGGGIKCKKLKEHDIN